MNLDLIIVYVVVLIIIIFIIVFGYILHGLRRRSTKASDYFRKLSEDQTVDSDEVSENDLTTELDNQEEQSVLDDSSEKVKRKHAVKYLMLLDMHKNNIYNKDDVNNEAKEEELESENYLSIKEIGALLNMKPEEISLYLIDEGLIEREHYTLILTEKGVNMGGQYISHDEVTWIEFPKDMLKELENITKIETETRKIKSSQEENIWFILIVIALIYFIFF